MSDSEFDFFEYQKLKDMVIQLHDIAAKLFDVNPILSADIRHSANELDLEAERQRMQFRLTDPQTDMFS